MLMNTHYLISKSVFDNIDPNKSFLLSEKNFIYGNIKPDMTSKYLLSKHYLDESFNMIMSKIDNLSKLTVNCLSKYFSLSKLSQEIGVICHFLCDFFCVAHSERWEMTHSMSKHITYEKDLNNVAKEINFNKFKGDVMRHDSIEDLFNELYSEYKGILDHKNDLKFATYICNCVSNYILDCILKNTAKSYTLLNCI